MAYLGLDVGTTGSKATVIDATGKVIAYSYKEYIPLIPGDGRAEINPNDVWNSVKHVLSEAARESTEPVEAIAIASFGESFVLLDNNDRVLANSMLYSDIRGTKEVEDILNKVDQSRLFSVTGMPINSMYSLNKILWIRKNNPELLKKANKLFLFQDFISYMLTGQRKIDYSLASRTMCFNYENKQWASELMELFDIDENLFSEPVPSGKIIGKVLKKVAEIIGLSYDTFLVSGAHDQVSAALGAGVLSNGDSVDGIGTTECITAMLENTNQSEYMRKNNFCVEPYVMDNKYVTLAFNASGGSVLQWFRDTFEHQRYQQSLGSGKSIYNTIEKDCPVDPSQLFVLPHFIGTGTPYMNPYSSGAILGLKLSTTKGEIYKAFLEGLSFEMKINSDILAGMGTIIRNLTCVGGGARSDLLLQIKADIMGMEIKRLEVEESGTMGLVILCATACGTFKSLSEAASVLVKTQKTFEPNLKVKELYNNKYEIYKKIYLNIQNIGLE